MFNKYFTVLKPKIVFGNLISVISVFLFASKGNLNIHLLIFTLTGTFCIISSSCIFNNIIDINIDQKMNRTKDRFLVNNQNYLYNFAVFALTLFFLGCILLYFFVNLLSLFLSIFGFFIYVIIYSLYMKQNSIFAILVGSIAGAMPPLIGYCSFSNFLDFKSLILFLIFVVWQIPHSYSLAILYSNDYNNANIPILPLIKGNLLTKKYILLSILVFFFLTLLLFLFKFVGYYYFIIMLIFNFIWLYIFFNNCLNSNILIWSKNMFLFSLIIIMIFNLVISLDYNI
ncbi:heme o synthase [Buchnera aphidicola (Neophyllaphis podocarpi)]|uniref:heme o synthase n=1 Tax=Buchnera aphidicola TaxID=9 RepID=UPI0031B84C46